MEESERTPQAIIFDFDFTLADSSRGIVECTCNALAEMGLPPPATASILATIGLSLPETLRQLTGIVEPAAVERFRERFHSHADRCMERLTTVYEYVRPVMHSLRSAGMQTGIVTTKFNRRIRSILVTNQMLELFDVMVGVEDVKVTKPHPEGLLLALERLGVPADSALYVGDHVVDAQAARGAGVRFVAVLTGKHQPSSFAEYPCEAVLRSVNELPDFLGVKARFVG